MNTTNVILSVIAVAVVIIAGIVVYQFYQQEQAKKYVQDAIAKVQEEKEQQRLAQVQQVENERQQHKELGAKKDKFYACLAKVPGFYATTSPNQTAINECAKSSGNIEAVRIIE